LRRAATRKTKRTAVHVGPGERWNGRDRPAAAQAREARRDPTRGGTQKKKKHSPWAIWKAIAAPARLAARKLFRAPAKGATHQRREPFGVGRQNQSGAQQTSEASCRRPPGRGRKKNNKQTTSKTPRLKETKNAKVLASPATPSGPAVGMGERRWPGRSTASTTRRDTPDREQLRHATSRSAVAPRRQPHPLAHLPRPGTNRGKCIPSAPRSRRSGKRTNRAEKSRAEKN